MACLFAYYDSRPIDAISRMIRLFVSNDADTYVPRYGELAKPVSDLIDSSLSLQHSLEIKTEFVQSLLIERLLKGRLLDREQLQMMLSQANLKLTASTYLVVLLRSRLAEQAESTVSLSGLRVHRDTIRGLVPAVFRCLCLTHDLGEETSVLLLGFRSRDGRICIAKATGYIREFFSSLPKGLPVKVVFGGGEPYRDLLSTHTSYEQAAESLRYLREEDENRYAWFGDLEESGGDYFYPLEMESRLLDALRSGDRKTVDQILDGIYQENFASGDTPYNAQRMLLYELCGTMHKIREYGGRGEITNRIADQADSAITIQDAFMQVRQQLVKMSLHLAGHGTNRIRDLADGMVDYLTSHYDDHQLSLLSLSERFGLTETYASVFFREQNGVNFSRYLEKLRIDSAARFLAESNLPVKQIAKSVGYNSDKAFRRAFKRMKKISPNAYRVMRRLSLSDSI